MRRGLLISVVALATFAGCAGEEPDLTEAAAEALQPRVAEIRQLAGQRQADQASAKLAELRLAIEDLRRRSELSDRGAQEALAAADAVQSQLALITTTTTRPPPKPSYEDDGRDHEGDEEDRDEDDEEEDEDD